MKTRKHNFSSKRNKSGFTLIEIMIVVFIISILATLVGPKMLGRSDDAKIAVTKTQIRNIGAALDLYKLDNGSYPSTSQGLQSLVTKPTGYPSAKNWKAGGYFGSVPKDAWGNDFLYVSPGTTGDYDLISLGSDGVNGGEADAADISISAL